MRGYEKFKQGLVMVLTMASVALAMAEGISVDTSEIETSEDGIFLNAEVDIELNAKLTDAVSHGVPLDFLLEFDLWRPRAYWFDESLAHYQEHRRISYVPVTRMYRLSSGPQFETYPSLGETLKALGKIHVMPSPDRIVLTKGIKYEASLSFKLDTTQLPKPLQLETFSSKEWQLASPLHRFTVSP